MALQLSPDIGIVEGVQPVRRGEGIVFDVDITDVTSGTASSIVVTVTRQSDESDVTATMMPTNTPAYASGVITLSELVTSGSTALGTYVIDIQFSVSGEGWSPGKWPLLVRIYD
jgi:hypothetical protein